MLQVGQEEYSINQYLTRSFYLQYERQLRILQNQYIITLFSMFFKTKKKFYNTFIFSQHLFWTFRIHWTFLEQLCMSIVSLHETEKASPWQNSQIGVITVLIRTNIDEKPQHSDSVKVKLWVSWAVEAFESHQKKHSEHNTTCMNPCSVSQTRHTEDSKLELIKIHFFRPKSIIVIYRQKAKINYWFWKCCKTKYHIINV
jgi:hypothetical protein